MNIGLTNEIARENWVKKKLSQIARGKTILDAGAGEQRYKKYCNHLKYTSQDFGQYDNKLNEKGLHTDKWSYDNIDVISDIVKIPVPNNSFDSLLCTEVFEHIPEPLKALKEFSRVLKPGGYLILTAPFCSLTHMAPYHFYSGFNRYFFEHALPVFGFKIIELKENGNYFEYIAQELRRLPWVTDKYSKHIILSKLLLLLTIPLIAILRIFNKTQKGSGELLCYGYHVFARYSPKNP